MKLLRNPTVDMRDDGDYIIIPAQKGQNAALRAFLGSVGTVDQSKEYTLKIERKRARRSLDANAYYFQLLRKISELMGMPLAEVHNRNLAEVGIAWTNSDGQRHWMLQPDDDFWLKQVETHFAPTDRTETMQDGRVYRWFYLLKPSHLMDSAEMSRIIDAAVQDAKAIGIETLPPDEIRRLEMLWRAENG